MKISLIQKLGGNATIFYKVGQFLSAGSFLLQVGPNWPDYSVNEIKLKSLCSDSKYVDMTPHPNYAHPLPFLLQICCSAWVNGLTYKKIRYEGYWTGLNNLSITSEIPIMINNILSYWIFRYPDFIAPCLGVHPVQSLCPDRSATLEVQQDICVLHVLCLQC